MPTNVDLDKWLRQFTQGQKVALEAAEKTINKSIYLLYRKVIDYTPIGDPGLWKHAAPADYVPGTLKASWGISFGGTLRNANTGRFVSESAMLSGGGISLGVSGGNKEATIYNSQPYAQRIEYQGWSTQAPNGMMRRAALEWTQIVEQTSRSYRK